MLQSADCSIYNAQIRIIVTVFTGECIEVGEEIRIKHLQTQCYLTVVTASDAEVIMLLYFHLFFFYLEKACMC